MSACVDRAQTLYRALVFLSVVLRYCVPLVITGRRATSRPTHLADNSCSFVSSFVLVDKSSTTPTCHTQYPSLQYIRRLDSLRSTSRDYCLFHYMGTLISLHASINHPYDPLFLLFQVRGQLQEARRHTERIDASSSPNLREIYILPVLLQICLSGSMSSRECICRQISSHRRPPSG